MHSTPRTTRIIHRSTVSVCISRYLHTSHQSTATLSLPFPQVTPFYRRGPRVTCGKNLPRFLFTNSLSHMIPLIPQSPPLSSFPPFFCLFLICKNNPEKESIVPHFNIIFALFPDVCLPLVVKRNRLRTSCICTWRAPRQKLRAANYAVRGITGNLQCPAQAVNLRES